MSTILYLLMGLAPSMDIIHELTQHFLIDIVEHRVVGTKHEVGRCIFQNLVNLGFQFFQVSFFECLTTVVESTQDGAMEQAANIGKAQALALPVV